MQSPQALLVRLAGWGCSALQGCVCVWGGSREDSTVLMEREEDVQ